MKVFYLPLIFLVLSIFVFFPKTVLADVVNPEFFYKTCSPDEMKIECRYRTVGLSGLKIYNECAKYENNPSYKFLVGSDNHIVYVNGNSYFRGIHKYCFKAVSAYEFYVYHIKVLMPLLIISLLLEIPIFLILILKSRWALFTVLSANIISVPLLYIATIFIPFSGFAVLIYMELIVVIFEAVFIKFMLKGVGLRRIFIYSLVANAVSAILGGVVIKFLGTVISI